ncbi:14101_t:CDS:2, partial [Entrophospora sp. SA101]
GEAQSRTSKFRKELSSSIHFTPSTSKKYKIHGASCDWLFSAMSQAVSNLNSNNNQPKLCLIRWGMRKRLDNINQITQDTGLNQLNLNNSGKNI